jgi:methylenetetrahydrofolate dehydrogenase (NADP+)/methenyltetrahydrofolate cyclohydrolase
MTLLDGLQTASSIRKEIAAVVATRLFQGQRAPHLAAVLVGNNPASEFYVNSKMKACEEVGFKSSLIKRDESISEAELLALVDELNNDPNLDGYIVQLPLPAHINEHKVILRVSPQKDVDGFHPENFGKMCLGLDGFLPATPFGIIKLLETYGIPTSGKHAVIVGRSHIVGLPMSLLLQRNANPGNCTVTITHSKTQNLKEICQSADIIIAAIGKPEFITSDMVKEGAVVVDVGINRVEDASRKSGYRITGDVDFQNVAQKCSFITPVPGGVGPMTIAALMLNTLKASTKH